MIEDAEVLVAGAGIAGALIAHQLSRAGVPVTIVDAGDRAYFDPATGADQRAELVRRFFTAPVKTTNSAFPNLAAAPSPDEGALNAYFVERGPAPFQSTYLRMVGGTTYHWLGTALRYTPNTFAERTRFGRGADWPFGYDELEPWYWRAEQELGVAGDGAADLGSPRAPGQGYPMPPVPASYNDQLVMAATEGLCVDGLPVEFRSTPQARNTTFYQGRPACAGSANCIPICPIGAKYDASVHLLRALNPALDPDSPPGARPARLLTGLTVSRVLVGPDGQVGGVAVRAPGEDERVLTARRYVLALNAIENAKVLLCSATESLPRGVANSSDAVGRYLMDHDVKISYARLPRPAYLFRGPLSTAGVESMRDGDFRSRRAAFRIELQNTGWSWAAGAPFTDVAALVNQGLTGERLRQAVAWQVNTQIELNGLIEPEPNPDNRVLPSATLRDALGIPRPELFYSIGQYSIDGAAAFWTAVRAVYARLGATEVAEVPGWQGAGHLMGTHRMGTDPAGSVCDGYGRSHDHPNLFLTGSGLFPTVDAANPTLTIAAVALRTAAHLIATRAGDRAAGAERS
ncbi:MAG TPA: GMC family oxidoreductase [Jatrophihabitans sp.]|nr:GMC family oxidoreductase [Jatrophihabitans sp.]